MQLREEINHYGILSPRALITPELPVLLSPVHTFQQGLPDLISSGCIPRPLLGFSTSEQLKAA